MAEHAVYVAGELGLAVIFLHGVAADGRGGWCCTCGLPGCAAAGKHPGHRGWQQQATRDPGRVRRAFAFRPGMNYGVPTWPINPLLVVDDDPRHDSENSEEALRRRYGPRPASWQVLTGSGGVHDYYGFPDLGAGRVIRGSSGKLGPGIDVRGRGGFVVGPGSRHHSGRRYLWELSSSPDAQPLAETPGWLAGLLAEDEAPAPAPGGGPRAQDARFPPADLEQLEAVCAFMAHARDGAQGLSEPEWFAQLGVIARCADGERLAQLRSAAHPTYDPRATAAKLRHAATAAGPPTCRHIEQGLGFPGCAACGWRSLVGSPVQLGRAAG